MSESSQAHRVALLFTQYWARDHGQTSLAAIRTGIGTSEKGEATTLMFEAFTDVVGVALDVYDVRHQQIWADAWQQFRSMSRIGKLWWSADNLAEAETWKADLTAKGAQVELKPEADGSIVRAIITLERSRAEEIMGYKVGDDEWLIEEDAIEKASCYVQVSGDASDVEDDGVQGFYQIDVSFAHPVVLDVLSDSEKSEIAKAVLDSFHSHQGISVLDDFEIRAFLPDGTDLNEAEDVDDARLVLRAEHLGQVNAADLPFLAASEAERFWEVVVPYFGLDTSFDYDANLVRMKEYLVDYDQNRGHHSGIPVGAVHVADMEDASPSQVPVPEPAYTLKQLALLNHQAFERKLFSSNAESFGVSEGALMTMLASDALREGDVVSYFHDHGDAYGEDLHRYLAGFLSKAGLGDDVGPRYKLGQLSWISQTGMFPGDLREETLAMGESDAVADSFELSCKEANGNAVKFWELEQQILDAEVHKYFQMALEKYPDGWPHNKVSATRMIAAKNSTTMNEPKSPNPTSRPLAEFVLSIKTDDEAYATVSGEAYSVAEASAAAKNKYPVTYPEPYDSIGCGYGSLRAYVEKECKRLANNFGIDWECVNSNELIFKIFDGDIETRERFVGELGKCLEVVKTWIPNFNELWTSVVANAPAKPARDDSPSP